MRENPRIEGLRWLEQAQADWGWTQHLCELSALHGLSTSGHLPLLLPTTTDPFIRLGNHPFDPGTRLSLQQIQASFRKIDLETTPCKGVDPKDRLNPKA